jgi:hypothetical protein
MNSRSPRVVALVIALGAGGCADFERGKSIPGPDAGAEAGVADGGDAGGALSFAADVHPLLLSGCRRCHVEGGQAGGTSLLLSDDAAKDLPKVLALVDLSNPAGSRLLVKSAGQGHTGGAIYGPGSPEHERILNWIQGGARP